MLSLGTVATLETIARASFPREAVAAVRAGVVYTLENIADDPTTDFYVSRNDWELRPSDVLWHSHTNGRAYPSLEDFERQAATAVPWAITSLDPVTLGADTFLFGDQVPPPPLVGRSFRPGVTDCYSIVRDWYKMNRCVTLPVFPRREHWWSHGEHMITDNFQKAGFFEVKSIANIAIGDVLLFKVLSSVVNHLAVYVGDDQMLHHLEGRLSRHDEAAQWVQGPRRGVSFAGLLRHAS